MIEKQTSHLNDNLESSLISSTKERYIELLDHEPKIVSSFVPKNALEQKVAFLDGEIRNPDHEYNKLDGIDFDRERDEIESAGRRVIDSLEDESQSHVYEDYVSAHEDRLDMLHAAYKYNHGDDDAAKEYMAMNEKLYGAPKEDVYRSLLSEKIKSIDIKKGIDIRADAIYDELLDLVPNLEGESERFTPSEETVAWMHDVATSLYSGMIEHIPDQEVFTPAETKEVFSQIIDEEFGEAADGWLVEIKAAQSINVNPSDKRIIIPENRGEISRNNLRRLVSHELGVHMMRAITGDNTDLMPLSTGLNGYYDAEEGLGKVMEQAIDGEFSESGVDHYITAGLSGIDGMDFRQSFEVKWRLGLLSSLKDGQSVTDAMIDKSRDTSYKQCMRIFRGTDSLPLFKDLAYYNGSIKVWKYLEEISGDDLQLSLLFLGKADPVNSLHRRAILETSTL